MGPPGGPGCSTCMHCGPWFKVAGFGFGCLDIAVANNTECAVCFDVTERDVRFPQCKHRVCPPCFRKIMFWDESRGHLCPVPYGCPPCPSGCKNPARGTQCYCDEYDALKDDWQARDPVAYTAWNDAEQVSIYTPDGSFGTKECPFCRAKYDRHLHGSMTGYTKEMFGFGLPELCYVCRQPATAKCVRCKVAHYCGRVCQRKHWLAGHKRDCAELGAI